MFSSKFLEGLPTFNLITDRKSFGPALNEYSLDILSNPRIVCWRLNTQRFVFVAKSISGKQNTDANFSSRAIAQQAVVSISEGSSIDVVDPELEKSSK